jgi:hypothetical protein
MGPLPQDAGDRFRVRDRQELPRCNAELEFVAELLRPCFQLMVKRLGLDLEGVSQERPASWTRQISERPGGGNGLGVWR